MQHLLHKGSLGVQLIIAIRELLLLLFVLDTVLLVVVAIYAPQLTSSLGYSLWQFLQFAFLVYLAYRIGKHKNQARGKS